MKHLTFLVILYQIGRMVLLQLRKIIFLASFSLSFIFLPGQEANFAFNHLGKKDGLSDETIHAFAQDQMGFMWIGTSYGLNRYDGKGFRVFKNNPEDSTSLNNNNIKSLLVDKEGRLWVGTQGGLHLYSAKKENFKRYLPIEGNYSSLSNVQVNAMLQSKDQAIWIGTAYGLNRFNPEKEVFERFTPDDNDPKSLSHNWVTSVYQDRLGIIWVGTGAGLNRLDPQNLERGFTRYLDFGSTKQDVSGMVEDSRGNLWVSTQGGGLHLFNRNTETFTQFIHDPNDPTSIGGNYLNSLFEDSKQRLWIATAGRGLNLLDRRRNQFIRFEENALDNESISNNATRCIFEDRQGNIWIGNTIGGGINQIINSGKQFVTHKANPQAANGLSSNVVTSFYERENGHVWIGTDGGGLNYFDPASGKFTVIRRSQSNNNSLNGDKVQAVIEAKDGSIWSGAWNGGLTRIQFNGEAPNSAATFTRYNADGNPGSLHGQNVTCLLEDRDGTLWIAHGYGIDRYNPADKTFSNYRKKSNEPGSLSDNAVWAMYEDKSGAIWLGTVQGGINKFNKAEGTFEAFMHDPDDPNSISENHIYAFLEDSKGRFWVGTVGGGLNLFDRATKKFTHYREKDGLPSDVVVSLAEDPKGRIWIGTGNGLARLEPETGQFRNYTESEGLMGNQFHRASSMASSAGTLYFGGDAGFNLFHPDSIKDNPFLPPVVITGLQLANKNVRIDSAGSPLEIAITESDQIRLNHNQDVITFSFAALNFISSNENQYAFKLEGFDGDWRYVGNQNSTTYTNLNAGNYTFRVIASNNDNIWNEEGTSLKIRVAPAPWLSTWAFVLYALLLGALVLFWRRQIIQQEKLRSSLRLQKLEAEKLQEIDRIKSQFFTNISHEFRTPLTVILGMTRQIMDKIPDVNIKDLHNSMNLVNRNGTSLLQLVNQILDLAKLESNEIKPKWVIGDIISYIKYLVESFESYAESKEISYSLESEVPKLIMDYDTSRLRDILTNLISNALKFSKENGHVSIQVKQHNQLEGITGKAIELAVSDDGIGIPADQLEKIFDRFYQTDNPNTRRGEGTGIGLALTKEMVKLLEGKIEVESIEGEGTTFRVYLPVHQYALEKAPVWEEKQVEPVMEANTELVPIPAHGPNDERPVLLIVEDNVDVVKYLQAVLAEAYRLVIAQDGQAGIEKAIETVPDIIISDVMMPKKNGYELCEFIKSDERTSHIPIILLTAKAGMDDKLAGLTHGADAYLTKPFHKKELFVRLQKLIELRQSLQQRYAGLEIDPKARKSKPNQEDSFVIKVREMIESHLSESDFSIDSLCKEIGMSRTQLHRKLTALTNKSTSHFIRAVRLQHALNYLKESQKTISEIAYDVGFSDPNYFSRIFAKEYGYPPSDLRK